MNREKILAEIAEDIERISNIYSKYSGIKIEGNAKEKAARILDECDVFIGKKVEEILSENAKKGINDWRKSGIIELNFYDIPNNKADEIRILMKECLNDLELDTYFSVRESKEKPFLYLKDGKIYFEKNIEEYSAQHCGNLHADAVFTSNKFTDPCLSGITNPEKGVMLICNVESLDHDELKSIIAHETGIELIGGLIPHCEYYISGYGKASRCAGGSDSIDTTEYCPKCRYVIFGVARKLAEKYRKS